MTSNQKAAHEMLIDRALTDGFNISVNDGEDWPVRMSTERQEILSAVHSVDESTIVMRRNGEKCRAFIVLGNNPDESVSDYHVCKYLDDVMEEIWEQFS